MPLHPARVALHLLLIATLIMPGGGAWATMAVANPAPAPVAEVAVTDAMPCHDTMPMDVETNSTPPCEEGCCPQATCDVSACLASACLPRFVSLPAAAPPAPFVFPWHVDAPSPRLIDSPLRPPIA